MLVGESLGCVTTVFNMPWEYLSLYFAVKPQNPQRSIMQNKQTTLFHNRWVLTELHINAELFFNDHLETVAGQPLSEVTSECSWAAQELLSTWKDCTNHSEKCLWDFLFPKRMVPLQTMNIDSLPVKGKNDLLSRTMVTEINVFRLLRGLYARRKEFNLRFYLRGKTH